MFFRNVFYTSIKQLKLGIHGGAFSNRLIEISELIKNTSLYEEDIVLMLCKHIEEDHQIGTIFHILSHFQEDKFYIFSNKHYFTLHQLQEVLIENISHSGTIGYSPDSNNTSSSKSSKNDVFDRPTSSKKLTFEETKSFFTRLVKTANVITNLSPKIRNILYYQLRIKRCFQFIEDFTDFFKSKGLVGAADVSFWREYDLEKNKS